MAKLAIPSVTLEAFRQDARSIIARAHVAGPIAVLHDDESVAFVVGSEASPASPAALADWLEDVVVFLREGALFEVDLEWQSGYLIRRGLSHTVGHVRVESLFREGER